MAEKKGAVCSSVRAEHMHTGSHMKNGDKGRKLWERACFPDDHIPNQTEK